jgi:sulfur-oxidizing protein SoxX
LALAVSTFVSAQTPSPAAQGLRIMADRELGHCVVCHRVSALGGGAGAGAGAGGAQGNFGPSLDGVGARYTESELRQWVTDARRLQPDTLMPPFGTLEGVVRPNRAQPLLTEAQIDLVVAGLKSLR